MEIIFPYFSVLSAKFEEVRLKFFKETGCFCSANDDLGVASNIRGNLACFAPLNGKPREINTSEIQQVTWTQMDRSLPAPRDMAVWKGDSLDCMTFLAFASANVPNCELEAQIAAKKPVRHFRFGSDRLVCVSSLIDLPIALEPPNRDETRVYYCLCDKFRLPRLNDPKHPQVCAAWQKGFAARLDGKFLLSWKSSAPTIFCGWLPQGNRDACLFVYLPVLKVKYLDDLVPHALFSDSEADVAPAPTPRRKRRARRKPHQDVLTDELTTKVPDIFTSFASAPKAVEKLEPVPEAVELEPEAVQPEAVAKLEPDELELEELVQLEVEESEEDVAQSEVGEASVSNWSGATDAERVKALLRKRDDEWLVKFDKERSTHLAQLAKKERIHENQRKKYEEELAIERQKFKTELDKAQKIRQQYNSEKQNHQLAKTQIHALMAQLHELERAQQALQSQLKPLSQLSSFIYICEYIASIHNVVARHHGIDKGHCSFRHIANYFKEHGLCAITAAFVIEWLSNKQPYPAHPNVYLGKSELRRSFDENKQPFNENVFAHFKRVVLPQTA